MAAQNSNESVHHQVVVSLPSEPQKAHHHHDQMVSQSSSSSQSQSPKTHELDKDQTVRLVSQSKNPKSPRRSDAADDEEASAVQVDSTTSAAAIDTQEEESSLVEDTGRERLKRHRVEVAGRVWIPDLWGQEELLKDWTDCTAFDASLVNTSIMSARAALVQEGRRANSSGLRIVNRC
uniref:Protein BIC1 n=1 Tax=Davidia involucrata TaxID=16924 RepID=A0A5B6YNK6_DAVIN